MCPSVCQQGVRCEYRRHQLVSGRHYDVLLSHCVNPHRLFCQLDSDLLQELMDHIQGPSGSLLRAE